jgi:hypothetical protein
MAQLSAEASAAFFVTRQRTLAAERRIKGVHLSIGKKN